MTRSGAVHSHLTHYYTTARDPTFRLFGCISSRARGATVLVRPDNSVSRPALGSCLHLNNKEKATSLHVTDRPITLESEVEQVSKANLRLSVA